MNNRLRNIFALAFLILSLTTFGASNDAPGAAKKEKAVPFSLKDQFNNEIKFDFPREKPLVLAIADKDGSEQLEAWLRPLIKKYGEKVEFQGVAELSGVPGIAKGVVRNIIKKKTDRAIMLDWKGDVSKSYGFQKDSANLLLIDKQGNIVARRTGEVNDLRLSAFYGEIEQLLR